MHIRVHRSVLAAAEKRALIWMAHRLPAGIHSDHLTALALAAIAPSRTASSTRLMDRVALDGSLEAASVARPGGGAIRPLLQARRARFRAS